MLDKSHNNALLNEDGFWESTKTGIIEDAIEDIILGGRDIESLTSFDIVFQILINRLVRPAEREGRALRIEDLRGDWPLSPLFWRDSYDAAKNTAGVSGQGGACQ